ncbi:carbohydrate-binding family 9-like protein [Edaphobacter aggregans]|uniref:carbohydrate-binding family 9-like protein n=1 Tax=Edaphobacter aggregans TaxID=570835 RepID=UPI0009FF1562|nr:carbohydrate-binding family 9-like protein [Edaphobacter aggregans]
MISHGDSTQATSNFSIKDCQPETDPTSAFWRSAPVTFLTRDAFGKPLPGLSTEVRSRWTLTHLYLLFTCPYDTLRLNPDPVTLTKTNKLWEWDVAEVFLGSDFNNIRRYKEFEVSPQGEWVDLDVDLDSPNHEEGWVWSSGFEVASRIDPSKCIWYGSMRIPFSAIDSRPASPGNMLRINFFRSDGPGRSLVAWQPTMKPTFHVPEAFGTLLLEKGARQKTDNKAR